MSQIVISSGGTSVTTADASNTYLVEDTGVLGVFNGGTISGVITVGQGGQLEVGAGGATLSAVISNGGGDFVRLGGIASDTTISSGGLQDVYSSGLETGATICSGGMQNVFSGGLTLDSIVSAGGDQGVQGGGIDSSTTIGSGGQQNVTFGGIASGASISSGGLQHAFTSGIANETTISSGGLQIVERSAVASGTTIDGGEQDVFNDGVANGTTVSSAGLQVVDSGGAANNTTVAYLGRQNVDVDAIASETTIGYLGFENVYGGGIAREVTISGGGTQNLYGITSNTTINSAGSQNIEAGGTANNTTVDSSGFQYVERGGLAIGTTLSGGLETVSAGGTDVETQINGGEQYLYGLTVNATIYDGSQVVEMGGTASSTTIYSGGSEGIGAGGTDDAAQISGGTLRVSAGGTAIDETIAGGTLDVRAGSVVSGSINFIGTGGTLQIDATTSAAIPTNSISGFAPGDIIDLSGISYDSGGTAKIEANNVLQITEGGNTYDFHLDPTQNFAGEYFHFRADSGGTGTAATVDTAPPVVVTSIAATTDNGATDLSAGHVVTITVDTSDAVTVSGTPTLQLNDNEVAAYQSGTGTNALTFTYTVQPGDSTADLQATGLNLPNGATIEDVAGNALTGSVAQDLALKIDTHDVYAYEATVGPSDSGAEFGVIDLDTGVFTPHGNLDKDTVIGIGNYGGVIYGAQYPYAYDDDLIFSIDAGGSETIVGPPGFRALSYDGFGSTTAGLFATVGGVLYGVGTNGQSGPIGTTQTGVLSSGGSVLYVGSGQRLYSVNTVNGDATFIGNTGISGGISALAVVGGVLYAIGGATNNIYTLNVGTGAATFLAASPNIPAPAGIAPIGMPPVLTAINNQTVEATSLAGAVATFAATATDLVDGTDPVVFTEGNTVVHSGDTFGIGVNTITASATDAARNTASEQFTITVVASDVLYSTPGEADMLVGNSLNDTFAVYNTADVVVPKAGSNDVVYTAADYTLPTGVDSLILEGSATQGVGNADAVGDALYAANPGVVATLIGNSPNDTFVVYDSSDVVVPKAGSHDVVYAAASYTLPTGIDTLILEAGTQGVGNSDAAGDGLYAADPGIAQTLTGNSANDTFVVYNSADVVVPKAGSRDVVYSAVSYTLPTGVDVLILEAGTQAVGNSDVAGDALYAANPSQVATLVGNSPNDTFVVYNSNDVVVPLAGSHDIVYSAVNYALPTGVDSLIMEAGTQAVGNSDAAGDTLYAADAGITQTLTGNSHNDTFVVYNSADTVIGQANSTDTVYAAANFTLPTNVDTLFLEGSASQGTGNNDAVNALFGNAGVASTLVAGTGADMLSVTGVAGTILTGGAGADTFAFPDAMGHDEVTNFGVAKDTLQFNMTLFSNFTAAMNHASQSGANTVFTIDTNDTVTLDNVTKTSLTAGNFHFV